LYNLHLGVGANALVGLEGLGVMCPCVEGAVSNTCDFSFYYLGESGLEQKFTRSITVKCDNSVSPAKVIINPEIVNLDDCFDASLSSIPICTLNDLNRIRDYLDRDFVLMNDIDASETITWNDEQGWEPIGNETNRFSGSFNGQDKVINNLYINRNPNTSTGFFGSISSNSLVQNIGLVDINILGIGVNYNSFTGGLVGWFFGGTIENCYVTGNIIGGYYLGGLVGDAYNDQSYPMIINKSFSTANLFGSNVVNSGGLVGFGENVEIYNSYSTGDVNIVPQNSFKGGLVGYLGGGVVENSYSTGYVSNVPTRGGLIGYVYDSPVITSSYWDVNTSTLFASSGGIGKTTSEMKQRTTFEDWDFDSIWQIQEGVSYPSIR
jgi:hypothetical protein